MDNGAEIRGVRGLHAKLYLFGSTQVVLTSANLTETALLKNHEFGLVATDTTTIRQCHQYFEEFWKRAGENIPEKRLDEWDRKIEKHLAAKDPRSTAVGLGDEGVYVENFAEPAAPPIPASVIEQAFVKFFGKSNDRAERSLNVLEEVESSGSHWACTYPKGKRPRSVRDGAVMFMGRLVAKPNDIVVYGWAIAEAHRPGQDDAGDVDFRKRPWKERWPHYVRVHDAEFIDGTLLNGISLWELMDALGSDAFASTQRNALRGQGNIEPRHALMQQPAVELSPQGIAWMTERLERAFVQYGKLSKQQLATLDWPGAENPE